MSRTYKTANGEIIRNAHKETESCHKYGCTLHAPTDHHMRGMPTIWLYAKGMGRICEHNITHPDPDHVRYVARVEGEASVKKLLKHKCCGCCKVDGTYWWQK